MGTIIFLIVFAYGAIVLYGLKEIVKEDNDWWKAQKQIEYGEEEFQQDLSLWKTAWENIQNDYKSGVISPQQFRKERAYMWEGRHQMFLRKKQRG